MGENYEAIRAETESRMKKTINTLSARTIRKAHLDFAKHCVKDIYKIVCGKIRWDELDSIMELIKKYGRMYVLNIKISDDEFKDRIYPNDYWGSTHLFFKEIDLEDEQYFGKSIKGKELRIARVFSGPYPCKKWHQAQNKYLYISKGVSNSITIETDARQDFDLEIHFEEV